MKRYKDMADDAIEMGYKMSNALVGEPAERVANYARSKKPPRWMQDAGEEAYMAMEKMGGRKKRELADGRMESAMKLRRQREREVMRKKMMQNALADNGDY